MTPKKRAMMTGIPNAVSPAIGATEAIFDEEYWEQKAKRYLSERDEARRATERLAGALRPFAALDLDDMPDGDGEPYADWERFDAEVTHGMVRRARHALAAATPPEGEGAGGTR